MPEDKQEELADKIAKAMAKNLDHSIMNPELAEKRVKERKERLFKALDEPDEHE